MKSHSVRITSSIGISAPAAAIWSRLCDAEMPTTAPCEFSFAPLGPPRPLRCELPEGRGGVGATRRCVTAQGTVAQRITEWVEGERLAFELIEENAGLGRHVEHMSDRFLLAASGAGGTRLVRETQIVPRGPCPRLRGLALSFAVRRVHRFTLRGFKSAAEAV